MEVFIEETVVKKEHLTEDNTEEDPLAATNLITKSTTKLEDDDPTLDTDIKSYELMSFLVEEDIESSVIKDSQEKTDFEKEDEAFNDVSYELAFDNSKNDSNTKTDEPVDDDIETDNHEPEEVMLTDRITMEEFFPHLRNSCQTSYPYSFS